MNLGRPPKEFEDEDTGFRGEQISNADDWSRWMRDQANRSQQRPQLLPPRSEEEEFIEGQTGETWRQFLTNWDKGNTRGLRKLLTFFEILEHFDMIADFTFVIRIAYTWWLVESKGVVSSVFLLELVAIVSSIGAYFAKPIIFSHAVYQSDVDNGLLAPVSVFFALPQAKTQSLIWMYKIYLTFTLLNRIIEDIPQVILATVFIFDYGPKFFSMLTAAWSVMLIILSSIHMCRNYPFLKTFLVMFSAANQNESEISDHGGRSKMGSMIGPGSSLSPLNGPNSRENGDIIIDEDLTDQLETGAVPTSYFLYYLAGVSLLYICAYLYALIHDINYVLSAMITVACIISVITFILTVVALCHSPRDQISTISEAEIMQHQMTTNDQFRPSSVGPHSAYYNPQKVYEMEPPGSLVVGTHGINAHQMIAQQRYQTTSYQTTSFNGASP
eukprot:GHVL01003543.1.p1 GENE.GHVL01003543.1~~GHVL01003543.1.p1  ORF type:complete len:443 (+),score=52.93 GHVL01003543.1:52-1380(+)